MEEEENQKEKSTFFDIFKELIKTIFAPKDELKYTEGMSEKHFKSFLNRRGISDFLLYRYYESIEDYNMGIYHMADGRKGIIFRVFPSSFSANTIEKSVESLINMLNEPNTVVHFSTTATRNVEYLLENFKETHSYIPKVDNAYILKEMIEDQYKFIKNGTNETIVKGLDIRIRDFVSTVSVLFPQDTTNDYIKKTFSQITGNLRELNPINFPGISLVRQLREEFNPDGTPSDWNSREDIHKAINKQIPQRGVKISVSEDDGDVKIGNWRYRTLTTKQYPNEKKMISNFDFYNIFFDRFGDNLQIPLACPFTVSLTLYIGDKEKDRNKALSKSRDDLIQTNKLKREVLDANPQLDGRKREAKRNIVLITEDGQNINTGVFRLTLKENNLDSLDRYTKIIKQRFENKDWIVEEEKFGMISLLINIFGLSLQDNKTAIKFLKRDDTLFTSNSSAICPLLGNINTNSMMIPYFDRNGQLMPYDNFTGDNYNEAKTGASGAGKSYSQAYAHIMKLAGGVKIRVIDNGGSYKRFCQAVGGTYIDVGNSNNISLNFFTKANELKVKDENGQDTDELVLVDVGNGNLVPTLHDEEVSGIVPIIGLMLGLNFIVSGKEQSASDATDESYLSSIITSAVIETYLRHGKEGRLEYTRDIIKEYYVENREKDNKRHSDLLLSVYQGLYDYTDKRGTHYSKFNTPNNIDLTKDYIVLETLGLKGTILSVVLVSLAFTVKSEFWKEGIKRKKTLDIDEGWMYKDNPIVIKILEDNARTLRKSMSSQGFITQGIQDFTSNQSMEALFGSSFHKFLLAQDKKEIQKVANGQFFPLDSFETRMFTSVANKKPYWGEAFYLSKNNGGTAFLIKASPKVHWLSAGADPDGNKKFEEVRLKYKLSIIETVRYLVAKEDNPNLSNNDLIHLSKSYDNNHNRMEEENRYWKEELNSAIKENRIKVRMEAIKSLEKNRITGYESFALIEHKDGSISNYFKWAEYLNKFKIEGDVLNIISLKSFQYAENNNIQIHLNLSSTILKDNKLLNILERNINNFDLKDMIVLELKDTNTNDNIEELRNFIQRFTDLRTHIALDNISINYHKMGYITSLNADYIKIEGELIRDSMVDEVKYSVLNILILYAKDKTIIATKIETEEEIEFLKKIGVHKYQGRSLKDKNFVI